MICAHLWIPPSSVPSVFVYFVSFVVPLRPSLSVAIGVIRGSEFSLLSAFSRRAGIGGAHFPAKSPKASKNQVVRAETKGFKPRRHQVTKRRNPAKSSKASKNHIVRTRIRLLQLPFFESSCLRGPHYFPAVSPKASKNRVVRTGSSALRCATISTLRSVSRSLIPNPRSPVPLHPELPISVFSLKPQACAAKALKMPKVTTFSRIHCSSFILPPSSFQRAPRPIPHSAFCLCLLRVLKQGAQPQTQKTAISWTFCVGAQGAQHAQAFFSRHSSLVCQTSGAAQARKRSPPGFPTIHYYHFIYFCQY